MSESDGRRVMTKDDEDAVMACADLVGRSGATDFQVGYLYDGVPTEQAGWYAEARYDDGRIAAENCRGPVDAVEQLAQRLLTGAKCRCGRLASLSPFGAFIFVNGMMVDGSAWTRERVEEVGQCLWKRRGQRWEPSCPEPPGRR